MSKEDKEKITKELQPTNGSVLLFADGFYLYVKQEQSKQKLMICVYVNGKVEGRNCIICNTQELDARLNGCEIARRFFYLKQKRRIMLVQKGRRLERKMMNSDVWTALPFFPTPKSFVSQLYKYNKTVKILSYSEYTEGLKALQEAV